jgi:RNA polymerase sigma factor (sigma-70 family)
VRESLELLIRREGWQPETFASAQEFLARSGTVVPSCLVIEVSVPELKGLDLQRRLVVERPDISIISIARRMDIPTAVQAIKAGALEFFAKPFAEDLLVVAIREALERSQLALKQEAEIQVVRSCYASLSPRERQVMDLLVAGLLNKQVGGELGISEHTVKVHRGRVMQKMQADSFAQLVRMAAKIDIALRPDLSSRVIRPLSNAAA